jgi:two-component system, NtrC family, response regulator AtoC
MEREESEDLTRVADHPTAGGAYVSDSSGEVGMIRRSVLVFHGSSSWMHQLPSEGRVSIGRSQVADLRIDDPLASRMHARLKVRGDRVSIRDLDSQNGTYVNGKRLEGERALAAGDTIRISGATLVLHSTASLSVAAALVDQAMFRQRLEDELDRAVRYERAFSVAVMVWPEPIEHPRRIERTVAGQLRRIDAASWASDRSLQILLAEAPRGEVAGILRRVRAALDSADRLRIGHASCPGDGVDIDALLASANAAALGVEPGAIASATRGYQTMTIQGVHVVIADPATLRLYALIERLAPVDLPVLVTGETGCGKELAASALHARSRRAGNALVSLNCAAIQDTLIESELFGHEKGAFSGATSSRAGLIEAASGSTLLLDEVGELALSAQAKLLRVLETRRVTRVGDVKEREVDVRIVAATNRDLELEVAAGRFRQDLFFRLSGAVLYLPPLRERPHELRLLASKFLDEACVNADRDPMTISSAAMEALLAHSWPGNVRELKNLMQYLAAAHPDDVLTAEHVAERIGRGRDSTPRAGGDADADVGGAGITFRPLAEEIRELEISRMRSALEAAGGNQTGAARLLSMPVRTFFEKVKQYGLSPARKKRSDETTDG